MSIESRKIECLKLTLDYQLGLYVGLEIVNRYLPTISSDLLHTNKLINVTDEEQEIVTQLENDWFENHNNKEVLNEKWNKFLFFNKILREKYLPKILKCYFEPINLNDEIEFKNGLIQTLWDCDRCCYSLDKEKIKIYNDENYYYTIIEFELDLK
jgi:hypothetical protein